MRPAAPPAAPDPAFVLEARRAAAETMAEALAAAFAAFPYLPVGLVPRAWALRVAEAQLAAVLALPAPTRSAALGQP